MGGRGGRQGAVRDDLIPFLTLFLKSSAPDWAPDRTISSIFYSSSLPKKQRGGGGNILTRLLAIHR